jgi:anaerobic magnesium-protoporphyrin IX monomethyl ester cyclase
MRFLLVNPYYPIDETPSPPLGLAFIAAALEQAGIEVKLLDFVVYPYSKEILETEMQAFTPDFVGVTSVTMSFDSAISVISDAKRINPDVTTVMGGPHVSFHVDHTLETFPELDFIIRGEGEQTIVDLANAVFQKTDFAAIDGIAYRNGIDIVSTTNRKPADVNRLPLPARNHIPLGRYRALGMPVSMTSSRGCPFKCIFCVGRKMVGAKVRYRDPKSVVDELSNLHTLGFHQINLADDLFTANKSHCHAVCDEIIKRNLSIEWTSFARVDTVTQDVLVKMNAAGCHTVSFGVESGNSDMLKRIKKGITLKQVIDAVDMCNAAGVVPHVSFILGLPGETPETMQETVEFGDRLSKMGVQHGFHILAPFPGTEVRDEIDQYDLKVLTDDWSQYHANRAIVETSTVDAKMMDDIVIGWEKKYNTYLGSLERLRETGGGSKEELWPLTRLEHTVMIYDLFMGDAVENLGTFKAPGKSGEKEALVEQLVRAMDGKIHASTKKEYTTDELRSTLEFIIDQGYLKYMENGGRLKWEWVDYLL